jgi:hypothetical protein
MLILSMIQLRVMTVNGTPGARLAISIALAVLLLVWFASENHRTAAQRAGRVAAQVMWIAGGVALGLAVVAALG